MPFCFALYAASDWLAPALLFAAALAVVWSINQNAAHRIHAEARVLSGSLQSFSFQLGDWQRRAAALPPRYERDLCAAAEELRHDLANSPLLFPLGDPAVSRLRAVVNSISRHAAETDDLAAYPQSEAGAANLTRIAAMLERLSVILDYHAARILSRRSWRTWWLGADETIRRELLAALVERPIVALA